jgi:hypothetical protein
MMYPHGYMEFMASMRPPFGLMNPNMQFPMSGGGDDSKSKSKSRERSRSRGKSRDSYKSGDKSESKSHRSRKSK